MAASYNFAASFIVRALFALSLLFSAHAQLSTNYYSKTCPKAFDVIKKEVYLAIKKEARMGASLLRLHFHDCFVNGCDASILLDNSSSIVTEKDALPNANSVRGFEVIDKIKAAVDKACNGPVVSCADILTIAARDSVTTLGGPCWDVMVGRRDGTTASLAKANTDIPSPFLDQKDLVSRFKKQGLDQTDLVALSGAHSIGFSQCQFFRSRIYNETIEPNFGKKVKAVCPKSGKNTTLFGLDSTPSNFDTSYFTNLVNDRGLLHSDKTLLSVASTKSLVQKFINKNEFEKAFTKSMLKMANIKVLTGTSGQIRNNCRLLN